MFTDLRRLLRNLCGRYQPKSLTQALAEYDAVASDSDSQYSPTVIFLETDMTLCEFEAVQEVTDDDQRSAQLALHRYTSRTATNALVDPGEYQQVRSILAHWALEESSTTRQAA